MPPLLLLLLPLLWGIECVGGWGSQAGSQDLDDGYQLQVQNSVTVQEGLCVFIPCTFSYPSRSWDHSDPVHIYWFWKVANNINHKRDAPVATNNPQRDVRKETKGRFQLLGDPQANNCSLHITGAQKEDSGEYVLRMEKGWTKFNYKKKLTVNVTALTNVPNIIMGSLESGHPSHVTCSVPWACDRGTPLTFFWTGAALRSQGSHSEAYDSSVIMLTPGPQDHGTNLTCRVTLPGAGVTTERTVTLNVSYAPQLFSPSCSWEAQDLRCSCSARAWPAPSLHWRLGDHLVEGNSSNSSVMVTSRSAGPWANSSLSLRAGLSPGLGIGCEARNDHGAHSVIVLLLPGKPQCEGGFVQAAVVGAGVASTLFLCPCLIFLMVKTLKRKKTKTAAGESDAPCHHCVGLPAGVLVRQLPRQPTPQDSPPLQTGPLPSGEVQEYQYASLVFHGLRPQEPQGQEVTSTTEYSEIKVRQ